jgi:molecular chaperone GrpE
MKKDKAEKKQKESTQGDASNEKPSPETTSRDTTSDTTKNNKENKKSDKKTERADLDDKLETIEQELNQLKEKYFRTLADTENTKKRLNTELKKERKYGSMSLADRLIDTLEVFDQALSVETDDKNLKNFLYGFKMIKDMIFQALQDEGVNVIECKKGDTFDPNVHEAVDKTHDPDLETNTIVKVVKKGYKFKDRLLRPVMVIANIVEEDTPEEEQDEVTSSESDENKNENNDEKVA